MYPMSREALHMSCQKMQRTVSAITERCLIRLQYYLRARFYNPVIGRFTQEDTYYGDGLNLYQYCQANAAEAYEVVTRKDPLKKDGSKGGSSTNGYSIFADGMSPEDATRYILNNEKAFFNEFSERASAAGLSDTQIAEVFEAMRKGDYAKMATYFDTSSPVDGAVFWSGNKEGAAQKPIWDAMSSQYANGAEGIATYAHPDGYEGKVRSNIEKPILEENDIIIQEGIIGAK